MEEDFFVGLNEPTEIRRNLLEASKLVIQNLQRHEKITLIREEKLRKIKALSNDIKKIKVMSNELKDLLPKTSIKTTKVTNSTELRKLEHELTEIEEELGKLK